ncbi:MAG: acetyl-CoA carboxylase biotin carboxyl carrier protein subunit [Bacteroidetes bacterium]|nr:acetyl-CoA carboxylase biotin carboxyl carrier protein subunit [Bacteroidota bacterium]
MTKEFLVDVDGTRVSIVRSNDQLFMINDHPFNASLVKLQPNLYSLLLNGSSHLIHVHDESDSLLTINGRTVRCTMVSERSQLIQRYKQESTDDHSHTELRAPMPGLIANILTQVGDQVTKGQGLIVLEAMKMENELRSPCTSRIQQIHIKEKDAVAMDALLIEFES